MEREFLQGPSGSPFALRNLLGWTITGPIKRKTEPILQETNFLSHSYRGFDHALTNLTVDTERHLSECVTSFRKIESTGTEFEETADTSTERVKEQFKFYKIQSIISESDMKLVYFGNRTVNWKTTIRLPKHSLTAYSADSTKILN